GGVVDRGDGDRDGDHVGIRGAVVDLEREAVAAVVVGSGGVGAAGAGQSHHSRGSGLTEGGQLGAWPSPWGDANMAAGSPSWLGHFAGLTDPGVERGREHPLLSVVGVALCAVLGGADDWVAVERFGKAKIDWFRRFLDLPDGIPSHDTFGR